MKLPTLSKIKRFFEDLAQYLPINKKESHKLIKSYMNYCEAHRQILRDSFKKDYEALEEKLIKKFDKSFKKFTEINKENKKEFDDIERDLDKLRSMCDMNNKLESDFKQRVYSFDSMMKSMRDLKYQLNENQSKLESVNNMADRCTDMIDEFNKKVKREESNYSAGLTNIAAQCGEKYDLYVKALEKKIAEFSISPAIMARLDNIEHRISLLSSPTPTEIEANGSGKRKELSKQA